MLTPEQIQAYKDLVKGWSLEQLLELNSRLCKRIKNKRDELSFAMISSMEKGDIVKYIGKSGRGLMTNMQGRVIQVRTKRVTVDFSAAGSKIWIVPAANLVPVKSIKDLEVG